MSKVGIMSMQRIKNYGSFLQAYALKKMIEELGHEVVFVDYHIGQPLVCNFSSNNSNSNFKRVIKVLQGKVNLKQKIQFLKHKKSFNKKNNRYLQINDIYNYNPKLDTLIIGSDEVFNCLQSNPNVGYSLELFGKDNNANRVITYAASFGNTTLDRLKDFTKDKEIADYLNRLDAISIRDVNSENIIHKLVNKRTYMHLDPVLIYDFNKDQNFNIKLNMKKKYLIIYAYNNRITDKEALVIRKYADKNKWQVYSIGGIQKYADKFINCTPFEVLNYFKNAEMIITDTFHGTIFSIMAHKPFGTIIRKSNDTGYGNEEKLIDLLKKFSLNDRVINDLQNIDDIVNKPIHYNDIDIIIKEERQKTYEYLIKNIR